MNKKQSCNKEYTDFINTGASDVSVSCVRGSCPKWQAHVRLVVEHNLATDIHKNESLKT